MGTTLDKISEAVYDNDCATIRQLIDAGWDVNQQSNADRETPLHQAAWRGSTEVARVLLQGGADVDMRDEWGRTPLHYAALYGHTQIVKCLVEHSATVNVRDKLWGWTPLHCAAWDGHTQTVKCLVEHSATVNVTTKLGRTPLHYAAERGHTQTVKCLVEHSATVNITTKEGRTPLYCAARDGHTAVVECLLQHGANVNVRTEDGKTAYDVCEEEEIKNLLKQHMEQNGRKMHQSVEQADEMPPHVPVGATADSSDQGLGASAAPYEKQFSSMLARYALSKGNTIPHGKAEVTLTVEKKNDSDLDILKLVIRQSGNFQEGDKFNKRIPVSIPVSAKEFLHEPSLYFPDYFPLIQSPTLITGSTTQFLAPGKNVMSARLHKSLSDALQSVVLLAKADGTGVGSGFRVGPTYVMTNCHVLKGLSYEPKENVAVFHFDKPRLLGTDGVRAAPIRAILAHCEELDVAVLDLDFEALLPIAFNECDTINKYLLPPPITDFATIDGQECIHFVGHPTGDGKVLDTQCTIDRTCTSPHNTQKLLGLHRKYNNDVFKKITDKRRALYQSSEKFGNGSSGSPGFVADHQKRACVAVMHSCGHFIRVAPGEFHLDDIEQGVRMECVYEFLENNHADLCADIFRGKKPARVV